MFIIYPSSRFVLLLLFLCHVTCPFQTEKISPFPSASLTHNPKSKILYKSPVNSSSSMGVRPLPCQSHSQTFYVSCLAGPVMKELSNKSVSRPPCLPDIHPSLPRNSMILHRIRSA